MDSTRKEKAEPEAEQQQRFKRMKRRREMTAREIQVPPTALGAAPPLAPGVPPPPRTEPRLKATGVPSCMGVPICIGDGAGHESPAMFFSRL